MEMCNNEPSLTLSPSSVIYAGPVSLSQHTVVSVHICSTLVADRLGVVVEVVLHRPLFGTVLTVFMPTAILLLLSQMVGVFSKEYLDMVIGVNLT